MTGSIKLIPFGFNFIENSWGGIYQGGSYLMIGPKKSGRTLLGLQFLHSAAKNQEVSLLFTNMRPRDLMIQSASINFDIQAYMSKNLVIVVRISPPNYLYDAYNADDYLMEYFNDIVTVVNQYKPKRLMFDEITPYIGFRNLDLLKDSYLHTLEVIEDKNITSLFIVGEPATPKAQSIVDILASYVTGVVTLKKSDSDGEMTNFQGGKVLIAPNIGHPQGRFQGEYSIMPVHGLFVGEPPIIDKPVDIDRIPTKVDEVPDKKPAEKPTFIKKNNDTGLTNSQRPPVMPAKFEVEQKDSLLFSNIYEYNDFLLLLSNQIALYKSTGQKFYLISIKLDPAATVKGFLNYSQLQQAVKGSTSKRDKICIMDDKILILTVKPAFDEVLNLVRGMKSNLPSSDKEYLNAATEYVLFMAIEITNNVDTSEAMIAYIHQSDINMGQNYQTLARISG